jgi:hypothetical protein
MCKSELYIHSADTALSNDSRTSTNFWKIWQLTYSRYQDLQHHLLILDRLLKMIRYSFFTATARTYQQDCHYYSLLQL